VCGRVQLLFLTELVDRPPFNIFKNKKRAVLPVLRAIQQPGDAGVREARHNLPLLFESFDETGVKMPSCRNLSATRAGKRRRLVRQYTAPMPPLPISSINR